MELNCGKVIA